MPFLKNISSPNDHPATFRLGIIAGFVLYSAFGILDYYMLPSSYEWAWKVRFLIVAPSLIGPLFLSYYSYFHKYLNAFTNINISIAQLGIFLIIFGSKPYENAYYDYYVGLVLVILWAAFIFKMKFRALFILTLITWIIYIIYIIAFQNLVSYGFHTPQFATFFNNVMFLISMTLLALLGNYLIDEFHSKLVKEKKNLESALEKVQESDQTKSTFLSTMSHEIRTPLNGIIGFSDIMIHEDEYEEFPEMAEAINRQGLKLLNIVDTILSFTETSSKEDLKERSKIQGSELFHKANRKFDYCINKYNKTNIKFSFTDTKKIKHQALWIYEEAFLDVLTNIIDNAVKFSDEGEIQLIVDKVNESGLILQFKDEGIGIDSSKTEDIFKNFYQIESGHNRKYEGIGMGLSYAKKLVELMDGNIWCEQNEDAGSSFFIHLPNCIRPV